VVVGYGLARLAGLFFGRMTDVPSSVIIQFVSTFGVWILAERLGLSGVVTIVVFGVTVAWRTGRPCRPAAVGCRPSRSGSR
jgi:NhaP-type Na+/H+ or K+/H+ antiporter